MSIPTTAEWVDTALSGNLVVDIGQIDKATAAALNKLVREGKLARCRGYWSNLLIGPAKTIWCAPHGRWAIGQFISVEQATPVFIKALKAAHADEQEMAA